MAASGTGTRAPTVECDLQVMHLFGSPNFKLTQSGTAATEDYCRAKNGAYLFFGNVNCNRIESISQSGSKNSSIDDRLITAIKGLNQKKLD
jgi:hypothetical protein